MAKELANTPEHSVSLWTSYRFRNGLDLGGGGVQFVDERWNSPTNVRQAPDYWKVDAAASYEVNELISLRLNLYNLTDERYIDRVGGGHFIPGAGRSAAATVLFDLDSAIRQIAQREADHPAVVPLTGLYHNLVRRWAEL